MKRIKQLHNQYKKLERERQIKRRDLIKEINIEYNSAKESLEKINEKMLKCKIRYNDS